MKNYVFVDYATQGYIALVGLLVLLFHGGRVPGWAGLVALHMLGMLAVHFLIRSSAARPGNRVLEFFRHFYPVLLFVFFYNETGVLNRMFVSDYVDPFFLRLEQRLFNGQPCIEFMERLPYVVVSEVFYAAYFSYYIMIGGVGLALFWRQRTAFHHYVSVLSFVFYACYLTYIFLPVAGPRGLFREIGGYRISLADAGLAVQPSFPEAIQRGPFNRIMAFLYDNFEAMGAAFPSSHVAIAVCTCWFSWLYLPRIRWIHTVMVILLCLSTVYCRYHYVVDVIAGVLAALVLVPLGNWLSKRGSGGTAMGKPPA